jgi:hypothetical protein
VVAYPGPGNGEPPQNWGQQQPAYQGFGLYQQQPPPGGEPPRKDKNLVMIFSIVAIVVIIAAVVTIVLLNRGTSEPVAQNNPPGASTSSSRPPNSRSTTTTKPSGTSGSAGLQPQNAGWTVIKNDKAKLIYEVPPEWTPLPTGSLSAKSLPNAVIYFPATVGEYQCEGNGYSRGGLGAGTIAKSDPATAATTIAKAFATEFYSSGTATVDAGAPKTSGTKTQVDATISTTGNNCLATKGKVSVLVIDSGAADYQFLVVNGDVTGGPATPPPPADADLQKMVDSARGY